MDRLQAYLGGRLSTPEGVFVLDETGLPKQGRESLGVARQYSGPLGKVGNCQVGVFLAYVSPRGQTLVDAGLDLPQAWTQDRGRCQEAGVPEGGGLSEQGRIGLGHAAPGPGAGSPDGSLGDRR